MASFVQVYLRVLKFKIVIINIFPKQVNAYVKYKITDIILTETYPVKSQSPIPCYIRKLVIWD